MKLNFEEIFAEGVGFLVKQLFLILLAVWTGTLLAGTAAITGGLVGSYYYSFSIGDVMRSPALLLSEWLLPNVIFLGINICRLMVYSESTGLRTWACLIGVEALFCMGPVTSELKHEPGPLAVAWVVCLVLIAMMGTAFWFWNGWRMNRWSTELVELEMENAVRRADLKEEFGTENAGARELM